MSFFSFFESYFLKVRYVMKYEKVAEVSSCVKCYPMDQVNVDDIARVADKRLASYLTLRRDNKAWVFFEYLESGARLGYGFLHTPQQTEWNDSLPTKAGEARISSTFVYPENRGRGIRSEICNAQSKYAADNCLKLWSVIERSNKSSIKAATKTGYVKRKNYLIKFLGRNVISIIIQPFEVYLLLGSRRARR